MIDERPLRSRIRAFNEKLLAALDAGFDVRAVMNALDPDPARYTDIDEAGGVVKDTLRPSEEMLEECAKLAEFRLVEPSSVAPCDEPTAHPAVGVSGDRRVIAATAWSAGGRERLVVWEPDTAWQCREVESVCGATGDIVRPTAVVRADGDAWLSYGRRDRAEMGIWYAHRGSRGWSEQGLVSENGVHALNQDAVFLDDGTLRICWQQLAGKRFEIAERCYRDGVLSPIERVSNGALNVWDPVVAGLQDAACLIGWTAFDGVTYGVDFRIEQAKVQHVIGSLREEGRYLLHPSVTAGPDGVIYCAVDSVRVGGHGGSGPTALRSFDEIGKGLSPGRKGDGVAVPGDLSPDVDCEIHVYRLMPGAHDEWERLPDAGVLALLRPVSFPRIGITAEGHVFVAYRALRRLPLMLYFWETQIEVLTCEGWKGPILVKGTDGPLEEVGVGSDVEDLVVASKADDRRAGSLEWTEGFGGQEWAALREHYGEVVWNSIEGPGRVVVARVKTVGEGPWSSPSGTVRGGMCSRGSGRAEAQSLTVQTGGGLAGEGVGGHRDRVRRWLAGGARGSDRFVARLGDEELGLYWGDLHRHSLISRCTAGDEPTLEDFYRYSWDICDYDFWAVTDHAENTSAYQWAMLQKIADVLHVPGVFVPFYGFEWTGAMGHYNVIYESIARGAPIYSSSAERTNTPAGLWAHLRNGHARALTIPHHPGSAMVPFDWGYEDEEYLRLVEVFQACRGNYEASGCFRQYSDATLEGTFVRDGLRYGRRVGFIASSDHGNGASYVGAFARALSREAVFEALRNRNTIGATTKEIGLDFRVNGVFMGGVVTASKCLRMNIVAKAYEEIARVEVVTNRGSEHVWRGEVELPAGWLELPLRAEWRTLGLGSVDWSGELEVEGPGRILRTRFWSPEVTEVNDRMVRWVSVCRNFRSQYGTQRGGIEVTVLGAPETRVVVRTGQGGGEKLLRELAGNGGVKLVDAPHGYFGLQEGIGGLVGLGQKSFSGVWEFPSDGVKWAYARVILVDGEMAWSSPVWVEGD